MKQCQKCGSNNEDYVLYCNACASSFETETPENNNSNYKPNSNPNMPQERTSGLAIAAMVLGIVGLIFLCCYGIGIIMSILAIIFGFVAKSNIKNSYGEIKGDGFALTGIILGFLSIAIVIILILVFVLFLGNNQEFMKAFEEGFNKGYNGDL